ncbi:unnamed protein product [Cylindrotheca closterium]|uniref:Peripheral subunit-binding (PSBD) domain-containing protein n=1 Tax=Cylindrotheca closterium TaxID=2856 RepID=A0AAD2FHP6_9STRA|nr:unnamed protein product [Cylindrotheca closterium]
MDAGWIPKLRQRRRIKMYRSFVVFLFLASESNGFFFPAGLHVQQTESSIIRRRLSSLSKSIRHGEEEDSDGVSERLRSAYEDWCQTYEETFSSSRLEVFSYHFMMAENYSKRTGVKVKLNEFAGLTEPEIEEILAIIGKASDGIERPLGVEFLDYEFEEEEPSSLVPNTFTDTMEPPSDISDQNHAFGSNDADDRIATATNTYLETMDKASIVPPTGSNLFKEISASILNKEESRNNGDSTNEEPDHEKVPPSLDPIYVEATYEETQIQDNVSSETVPNFSVVGDNPTGINAKMEEEFDTDEAFYLGQQRQGSVPPSSNQHHQHHPQQPPSPSTTRPNKTESPAATSMAREAANQANIDLSLIPGTGKNGIITLHDVELARDSAIEVEYQSYTSEERIRNGPFRHEQDLFMDTPFDDGESSFDPETSMDHDATANVNGLQQEQQPANGMGYMQQGPDDSSSQDMFYQNRQTDEMFQEDPTAQYDMHADKFRDEHPYHPADSHELDQHQYGDSDDDKFRQELQDHSNHQSESDIMDTSDLSYGPTEELTENVIGNEEPSFSSDHSFLGVDPLDERIDRAIHGDEFEFVSQQQYPQVEDDFIVEQLIEKITSEDGPIGLHDLGNTVPHDKEEDIYQSEDSLEHHNEVLAEFPDLEDAQALESERRMEGELHSGNEAKLPREDEASAEEEMMSTGWIAEEPEKEHYDLPDWVVGNAEPLVPPHLSGAEMVTGNYHMDTGNYHMDTGAPKEEKMKYSTTNMSSPLDNTNRSLQSQSQGQMASAQKAPTRKVRRVASPKAPSESWVFLDSVTTEVVAGDQVTLQELTFWMSEAKVQKWCKKVGDPVHVGETLMTVACDTKISKESLEWAPTQDVKATSNGFLVAKHFGVGEMMSIGWTVGVIGTSTEGLPTVAPEPVITYEDEEVSKAFDEPKEKPKDVKLSNPSQRRNAISNEGSSESRIETEHDSTPRTAATKRKSPTAKNVEKGKKQESSIKPAMKSSLSIDWEPRLVKMEGLNHVLVPFLQKKIDTWERNARFHLPATSSLDQEVLTSQKTKMTIRWEPQLKDSGRKKSRAKKRKMLNSQHSFARLPAVSWEFEKSQIPAKSSPAKEKRMRQIFFFEPTEGVARKARNENGRKRLGGKTQWASFPTMIKWENMTHPLPKRQYPQKPDANDDQTENNETDIPQKMVYATPMARAAARLADLDLQGVSGTGDGGRITLDDVKDVLYPMLIMNKQEQQHQQHHQKGRLQSSHESSKAKRAPPASSPLQSTKKSSLGQVYSLRIPYASPMARKLAEEYQIDLATVMASGPRGRILLDDVQKALDDKTTP